MQIPLIATQEVYYLNPNMYEAHNALTCIGSKSFVDDLKSSKYSDQHFLKTSHDLANLFSDIHFNGESGNMSNSTYTILNVCFPISNDKAAMLDFQLDLKGIACSKGSACQSGSSEGSHVLSEIQNDSQKKLPSVRFSCSHNNTKEEVDYLMETLKEFINS